MSPGLLDRHMACHATMDTLTQLGVPAAPAPGQALHFDPTAAARAPRGEQAAPAAPAAARIVAGRCHCPHCPKTFSRTSNLQRHCERAHAANRPERFSCPRCNVWRTSYELLCDHYRSKHGQARACDRCCSAFDCPQVFRSHRCVALENATFLCVYCRETFTSPGARTRHFQSCRWRANHVDLVSGRAPAVAPAPPVLDGGGAGADNGHSEDDDEDEHQQQQQQTDKDAGWTTMFSVHDKAQVHTLPLADQVDIDAALIAYKQRLIEKLAQCLDESSGGLKWWLVTNIECRREIPGDEEGQLVVETAEKSLRSGLQRLLKVPESIPEQIETAILEVLNNAEQIYLEGSNWVIGAVLSLDLNTADYRPVVGSREESGGSFMPVPDWIGKRRKSLLNIANKTDNRCFEYSVLAHIHYKDIRANRHRPAQYRRYLGELNMGDWAPEVYRPMKVANIPKFESMNPNISICVLSAVVEDELDEYENITDDTELAADAAHSYPAAACVEPGDVHDADLEGRKRNRRIIVKYCTKEKKQHHVTLLLLDNEVTGRSHYVLVTDFHSFMSCGRKWNNRIEFCSYCLNPIWPRNEGNGKVSKLAEHEAVCRTLGAQRVDYMPGSACFDQSQFKKCQLDYFNAYYDFECALPKVEETPDGTPRKTQRTQRHVPVAFSILVTNVHGDLVQMVTKHGTEEDDVAGMFLTEAFRLEAELYERRPNYPIHMSDDQIEQHEAATVCYLCRKPFSETEPRLAKCADHDHNLQFHSYIGAAHNKCNGAKKRESRLTFWAHNAQRYDMHCVFKALISHPMLVGKSIDVLPTTHDSYKSATIHINRKQRRSIKFLDSFNFVSASLDTISTSLSPHDLFMLYQVYPNKRLRDLLMRKGVYCYEHVQSYQQLVEETQLPGIDAFYSSLTGDTVSEEEYERAKAVWSGLGCKTLLDYTVHYLKTDVILLA
ncbi:uncharacterized protein LOC117651036 [Thrips palmi]|uniref:Uncharacterized protein LOC117651036 n=1 Tax=Thrips palmi TaxID=161013 RepID=A0A6P9A189_THRPL|nr:uncharacterized protein LOC117651036 [Thrips palmi]